MKSHFTKANVPYDKLNLPVDRLYVISKCVIGYVAPDRTLALNALAGNKSQGQVTGEYTLLQFFNYLISSLTFPSSGIGSIRNYLEPYLKTKISEAF